MAKAAGSELGALKSLYNQKAPGTDLSNYNLYGGYNSPAYRILQQAMVAAQTGTTEPTEAMAGVAGKVVYRITVTASFDLKTE